MVWHIGDFEERYSVDIFGGHICDAGFQLGFFISWNFKTAEDIRFTYDVFFATSEGINAEWYFAEFTPRHPAVEHFWVCLDSGMLPLLYKSVTPDS